MPLRARAEEATGSIVSALGIKVTPEQATEITKIVEAAMIDAYRDCTERNAEAALSVCEEDLDRAHKIAEEMRRANVALIANLTSLR